MLVRAETADNRLGGIVQITADDEKVVIPVDPTATLRGRLIQQSTGQPVVNQWINCGVKAIYPPQRMSIWGFYNSARTDAQGKFTLVGLIPNWKFDLKHLDETGQRTRDHVDARRGQPTTSGHPGSWRHQAGCSGRSPAAGQAQTTT